MFGEEIHDTFLIIADDPTKTIVTFPVLENTVRDCPICLGVFADINDTSIFKNDSTAFLYRYSVLTGTTLKLQKQNGTFQDIATINDGTYGTYFPLGFIIDEKGRNYLGFLLDWRKVLVFFGEGFYRLVTVETSIFGEVSKTSPEYCLRSFSNERAEGTLKLETNTTQIRGDILDQTDYIDFGVVPWYNSI